MKDSKHIYNEELIGSVEALKNRVAELEAIYVNISIAMILMDRELRVCKVNEFASIFTGQSREKMIGLRGGDALCCRRRFDDPEGCGFGPACAECSVRLAVLDTFADRKSRKDLKVWFHYQRGEKVGKIYLLVSTAYILSNGAERVLLCAQDITRQIRAEDALQESESFNRILLKHSPSPILVVNHDCSIKYLNPAFEKITGYAVKEILGKKPPYPWWIDDPRSGDADEKKRHLNQEIRGLEKLFQDKAGNRLWVEINATPIIRDGELNYSLETWFDITKRKQMEEERDKLQSQFIQAQKMEAIGALAGGVAHDFNNLLTTVIGNSQFVLDDLRKDDPLYEDIEEIRKAGERGAILTRQLLAFSRKEISQPEILDINEVVLDMEKLLRRLIGEDIEMRCVLAPGLWKVKMDPGHMEQIIMNLAVNARDAMPKGGKLTIETSNVDLDAGYFRGRGVDAFPGRYMMLAITDAGKGMDGETMSRMFEPFFTTKERGVGTGLGLSMVYGIIKQNNGFIWPYSEPGMGTVMKIYLPGAEGDQAEVPKKEAFDSGVGCGEAVLLVEDDDSLRKLARKVLQKAGYEVLTAANGKDAIRVSDELDGEIHLLITDVVMPGMSGKELAERLEELRPSLKVLFISGYTNDIIADHGILQEGTSFIPKPFTADGLARKVSEVLNADKRYPEFSQED